MSFGERVFSILLLTYPTSFRRRYREDLLAFFRADRKHAKNVNGVAGFTRFWRNHIEALGRGHAE